MLLYLGCCCLYRTPGLSLSFTLAQGCCLGAFGEYTSRWKLCLLLFLSNKIKELQGTGTEA